MTLLERIASFAKLCGCVLLPSVSIDVCLAHAVFWTPDLEANSNKIRITGQETLQADESLLWTKSYLVPISTLVFTFDLDGGSFVSPERQADNSEARCFHLNLCDHFVFRYLGDAIQRI